MNSRKSWLCDGVSKNSRQYPGVSAPHVAYENYGSHCQICGLPREAMVPFDTHKPLPQPISLVTKSANPLDKLFLSERLQILLVFGIPTVAVIVAIYFLLSSIYRSSLQPSSNIENRSGIEPSSNIESRPTLEPKPTIELSQTYEDPTSGIRIKYPNSWEKQDSQDPTVTGDIAKFFPAEKTESDACQTQMALNFDDFQQTPPSVEEYKKLIIEKITTLNPNTKINDESAPSTTLSNSNAYRLVYTRQVGKCNLQVMETGTIKNNKAYYITYTATADKYEQFLNPAEEMIKSFEIK